MKIYLTFASTILCYLMLGWLFCHSSAFGSTGTVAITNTISLLEAHNKEREYLARRMSTNGFDRVLGEYCSGADDKWCSTVSLLSEQLATSIHCDLVVDSNCSFVKMSTNRASVGSVLMLTITTLQGRHPESVEKIYDALLHRPVETKENRADLAYMLSQTLSITIVDYTSAVRIFDKIFDRSSIFDGEFEAIYLWKECALLMRDFECIDDGPVSTRTSLEDAIHDTINDLFE